MLLRFEGCERGVASGCFRGPLPRLRQQCRVACSAQGSPARVVVCTLHACCLLPSYPCARLPDSLTHPDACSLHPVGLCRSPFPACTSCCPHWRPWLRPATWRPSQHRVVSIRCVPPSLCYHPACCNSLMAGCPARGGCSDWSAAAQHFQQVEPDTCIGTSWHAGPDSTQRGG